MGTNTIERATLKAFITGFLSDPAHDNQSSRSMTAEVFRIALASLEAEPVSVIKIDHESSLIKHVKRVVSDTNVPPVPVAVPDGYRLQPISEYDAMCAAMLQGAEPDRDSTCK